MLRIMQELVQQGAKAIIGNHEARLLSRSNLQPWQKAWIPFIHSMSYYFVDKDYLFVHAGIRPGIPIEMQTPDDLTEIRDEFFTDTFVPDKHVVFGHTPTHRLGCSPGDIYRGNCKIGIDTGAKHQHRLTLADLTNRLSYSCSTSNDCLYSDLKISDWAG
jgi:serine/threonine protein phosphatase 1